MGKLNSMQVIFLALLIVGGLNWGLVGVLNFDLVATLFGDMSLLSRLVYAIVGISAVVIAGMAFGSATLEE